MDKSALEILLEQRISILKLELLPELNRVEATAGDSKLVAL